MKCIHRILLTLSTIGLCQGDSPLRRDLTYWLQSDGPAVTIHMRWDQAHCSESGPRWYSVELCTLQRECSARGVSSPSVTFASSELFPLIFWNVYTAAIKIYCEESGWSQLTHHQIHTGPGELMPLQGLRVTAGVRNATMSWTGSPQGESEFDDSVEISVCRTHPASNDCAEMVRTDFNNMEFTIDRLMPGVEYTADLRLLRDTEGLKYRSPSVTIDFRTAPSNTRKFPPIDDIEVRVSRKDEDLDLELRFTKPEAPLGAIFTGVELELFDDRNTSIVNLGSPETIIKVRNVPYSAFLTVNVRVVYEDDHERVESTVLSKIFGTGPRVVPDKPRILQVMSISNSSALIRWSTPSPRSEHLSGRIILNNADSIDIERLGTGFLVIDKNLEPNRVYNVTLDIRLPDNDGATISFAEQTQFRMLPEDALTAKPVIEDILGGTLHLRWEVTLPAEGRCVILINYCRTGKICSTKTISDPATKSTHLEIERFVRYGIIMNTTCMFDPDIVTFGVSEALEIAAATLPGPPLGVTITTVRGRRIVQWIAESDERFKVECYKIDATEVSTSKRNTILRTSPTFDLAVLEPRSRYVLSISACVDAEGRSCGAPAQLEATTESRSDDVGYPARPTVKLVSQTEGQIVISWSVPTDYYGPVDGYEFAYGRKDDGFSPSNWVSTGSDERSATVSRLEAGTTYVFNVVAFNVDRRNRKLYSPTGFLVVTMER